MGRFNYFGWLTLFRYLKRTWLLSADFLMLVLEHFLLISVLMLHERQKASNTTHRWLIILCIFCQHF